jgi:hypothetical protein
VIWCVYALTAVSGARPRTRGLRGEPLTLVSAGRVAAIAGRLPRSPRPTRGNLERYHAVVQHLWHELPSVLPVRYGTWLADPDELMFILRARGPAFSRTLRHLRGRGQMTVRIRRSGPDADRPPHDGRAGPAGPEWASGSAYLRSRAADAARARHLPERDLLRPAVSRWIRDERVDPGGIVATVYHLVPRASAEAYRRAVCGAARSAALDVTVSGPFAAYAFADGILGV